MKREIVTSICGDVVSTDVGIISFSITRLKPNVIRPRIRRKHLCWNHKFLDYEIETSIDGQLSRPRVIRWNHKFLDYEIETEEAAKDPYSDVSWNHKFLDYEIETNKSDATWGMILELES